MPAFFNMLWNAFKATDSATAIFSVVVTTACLCFGLAALALWETEVAERGQKLARQAEQIAALEARVTQLEARQTQLEARVTELEARQTEREARQTELEAIVAGVRARQTELEAIVAEDAHGRGASS